MSYPSVCLHWTTLLPLHGFSWSLIFEDFDMYMSYGWGTQWNDLVTRTRTRPSQIFPVTSSSIKNPMRRHNAITQCASGNAWADISRSSIRITYSSVTRHIGPCICHTIRHIRGNDVIPLREVWFVIFYTDGLAVLHHAQHCDGKWLILDSYCASFKLLCHVVRMRVLTSNSHIANDTWPDAHYRIAVRALTGCALCYRIVMSHWIFNRAACYRKNLWKLRSMSCNKVISLGPQP